MDLRRTRSRSKTPFEKEGFTGRITRSTVQKSYESFSEEITAHSSAKPNKIRNRNAKEIRIKTSDYSSEDGEYEVSSSDQNTVNEVVDRTQTNGGQYSALKIFRDAKEYWNRYPKTDYTYSRHSKDRIEVAPGVVNMPNMSRESYRKSNEFLATEYIDRQTSTDSFIETNYNRENVRQALFRNNNVINSTSHYKDDRNYYEESTITRIRLLIQRIFLTIFTFLHRITHPTDVWITSFFSILHKYVSKIMLLDAWVVRGNQGTNRLVALCLLPLLFIGGLHFLLTSGVSLAPPCHPHCASIASTYYNILKESAGLWLASTLSHAFNPSVLEAPMIPVIGDATVLEKQQYNQNPQIIKIQLDSPINAGFTNFQLKQIAENLKSTLNLDFGTDSIIKIILEDPNLQRIDNSSPEKIASAITDEQLAKIGASIRNVNMDIDANEILQQILQSESLKRVINNVKDESDKDKIILDLKKQNEDLRVGLENFAAKWQNELAANMAKLNFEMKKCCRRSFVQIEGYVSRILSGMLEDHIKKSDLVSWLGAIFVAKDTLEGQLGNITSSLRSEFDSLIENNVKHIMDEVALKINHEMEGRFKRDVTIQTDFPGDEYVKRVVKETLALYDADKTGLVDYALESGGGQVVSTRCTQNYQSTSAVVSIFGIPLWYVRNTPRTVLTPSVHPGECWSFQNFPGYLVIKLSIPITVEAFSYEHVSRNLIPHGNIDSAPKNFSVYGLREENDHEPLLIGEYIYDKEGDPLQYFAAQFIAPFNMVELRISSNHGNPKYTCLYRFRVHGKPYLENT